MAEDLSEKVDRMKQEIDALQIATSASTKPWYKNISTILSAVALLFSFGTTYVSYQRTEFEGIQSARQELRGLLQRLAALPKENLDATKRYSDDPGATLVVGGFINQENAILSRQAAEIAKRLPRQTVSAGEFYAVAVALQSSYELEAANEFLALSIASAKDFSTEISALRMSANLHFIGGKAESGRVEYQKALNIFVKYPHYDTFTRVSTNVWTELAWASSEASTGAFSLANQHVDNARVLLVNAPPGLGVEMLRSQISQAKNQLASGARPQNAVAGPQLDTWRKP